MELILPLPPSMNRLWRTGKGGAVYRSPKYEAWRVPAMWQASVQAKGIKFEGSYKLTLLAVRPDKRKRDLDNLFKAASDCLVAAGIVDDSKCEWLEGRWVKEGPQCTLVIEEINNDD